MRRTLSARGGGAGEGGESVGSWRSVRLVHAKMREARTREE